MEIRCKIPGCGVKMHCREYCARHYKLFLRRGILPRKFITGDDTKRFWSKVEKTDTCWLWRGFTTKKGYGHFALGRGYKQAHRHSYELLVGKIPSHLQIDHLCRVRNCVNPDHLEPVTSRENALRGWLYRKTESVEWAK